MKVAIAGIGHCGNRGVEALAVSVAQGLQRVCSEVRLQVLATEVAYNRARLGDEGIGVAGDAFLSAWPYRMRHLASLAKPLARRAYPHIVECGVVLRDADLVVASGGDNFSSDYGDPERWLRALRVATAAGTPIAFLGQSIGPFRDPDHAECFVEVARRAEIIAVRESASLRYTTEELGLPRDRVFLTADPAFLLAPSGAEQSAPLVRHYGLDAGSWVALAPSGSISRFSNLDPERHASRLCELIREFFRRDLRVLLVPHVTDVSPAHDDRLFAIRLVRRLGGDPRLVIADLNHPAAEYKALIARCQFLVAERMHAAIAGLSSGVPTVVITYSIKGDGIMDDLFSDARGRGLALPVADFVTRDGATEAVLHAWEARDALRAELGRGLPAMRALADRNFELLRPWLH